MQKRMQRLTDEEKRALVEAKREVQRILRGIPEEAIELLKEEFGYGYPVYEWKDKKGNALPYTTHSSCNTDKGGWGRLTAPIYDLRFTIYDLRFTIWKFGG